MLLVLAGDFAGALDEMRAAPIARDELVFERAYCLYRLGRYAACYALLAPTAPRTGRDALLLAQLVSASGVAGAMTV